MYAHEHTNRLLKFCNVVLYRYQKAHTSAIFQGFWVRDAVRGVPISQEFCRHWDRTIIRAHVRLGVFLTASDAVSRDLHNPVSYAPTTSFQQSHPVVDGFLS